MVKPGVGTEKPVIYDLPFPSVTRIIEEHSYFIFGGPYEQKR